MRGRGLLLVRSLLLGPGLLENRVWVREWGLLLVRGLSWGWGLLQKRV
ncbi:hypothetical protein Kisp01_03880 [Kineosporia sp. NBRC 101677]|nr:hypothetical protein [Kineosporia sp. NBRC 101677]GLY13372.1 hypothetical protein Kisp01_03880 [Kineosporia sp. NBRC 101677]